MARSGAHQAMAALIVAAVTAGAPVLAQPSASPKSAVPDVPSPPPPPLAPRYPTPPTWRSSAAKLALVDWIKTGATSIPVQRTSNALSIGKMKTGLRGDALGLINGDGWQIEEGVSDIDAQPLIQHEIRWLDGNSIIVTNLLGEEKPPIDALSVRYWRSVSGGSGYAMTLSFQPGANCAAQASRIARQWGARNPRFQQQADSPYKMASFDNHRRGNDRAIIAYTDDADCDLSIAVANQPSKALPTQRISATSSMSAMTMARRLYMTENVPMAPISATFSCAVMPISRRLTNCTQQGTAPMRVAVATSASGDPLVDAIEEFWQATLSPGDDAWFADANRIGAIDLPDRRELAVIELRNQPIVDLGGLTHAIPTDPKAFPLFNPASHFVTSDDYPPVALRQEIEGVVTLYCAIQQDRSIYCPQASVSPPEANILRATTLRLIRRRNARAPEIIGNKPAGGQFGAIRVHWVIPQE